MGDSEADVTDVRLTGEQIGAPEMALYGQLASTKCLWKWFTILDLSVIRPLYLITVGMCEGIRSIFLFSVLIVSIIFNRTIGCELLLEIV